MSRQTLPEPLADLLIAQATQGLDDGEQRQLDALLGESPDADDGAFEYAAAAASLAFLQRESTALEKMPAALRARIVTDIQSDSGTAPAPNHERNARESWLSLRAAGWYVAASLAAVWLAMGPGRPPVTEVAPATLAAQRMRLIEESADVVHIAWGQSTEAGFENASGDVVWSNEAQTGYMRLVGLPVNVPTQAQYQLWIVDPERDEKPVDGGVFDITSSGEAIVPIDAKLRIKRPAAFAITREQPGGVVVSAGPLLLVAAAEG